MPPAWKYLFGPVLSRRLGQSLGVDLIPSKLCTLDCVYCEVGRTDKRGLARKEYSPVEEVLKELGDALRMYEQLDHVTISGSGEPTLHSGIGRVIRGIKSMTDVPVAVLTNGTLLTLPEVREDLFDADIVSPSLDAVSQEAFERVDRPHPKLRIAEIVEGIRTFRSGFHGELWLEVLFVKGLNDDEAELARLKATLEELKPDRLHLNTVVRPPAESFARPLSRHRMNEIAAFFGGHAEVIGAAPDVLRGTGHPANADQVLALLERRPMQLDEMTAALEMHSSDLERVLEEFIRDGRARRVRFDDQEFYQWSGANLPAANRSNG